MKSQVSAVLLSFTIGVIGWAGSLVGLLALPGMIFLWRASASRRAAFLVTFAYYLGAARGQISGTHLFYGYTSDSLVAGVGIWIISSAALAGVWAIGWSTNRVALRVALILVALSIPPLGLIGWANPLTSAGTIFPGLGWIGLAAMILTYCLIAGSARLAFFVPIVVAASICNLVTPNPTNPPNWFGLDTHLGANNVGNEFSKLRNLQAIVANQIATAPRGSVVLLPESVGGNWSLNKHWWARVSAAAATREQTILIGAVRPDFEGANLNVMTGIGLGEGIELINRVPVPGSMWRPWDTPDHFRAAWGDSGIAMVGGKRVASLICYEQILVFPVLMSMAHSPEVILAPANGWWARRTKIQKIQEQAVLAWGRLFSVPVVIASNI